MRFLAFIASLLFSISLQANTAATTENEPSALVNGVNVITGDLYIAEEDLVVQGVEPIRLQRNYISQKGHGYWNMFPYHRAFLDFNSKTLELIEKSGARLHYRWKTKKHKHKKNEHFFYAIDIGEENSKGITNTAKGKPSGKTNLKNQIIDMQEDNEKFSVLCPDGTRRFYEKTWRTGKQFTVDEFMDWNISSLPRAAQYLLVREELANGHQIIYKWPRSYTDTWEIKTCDASHDTTYAWVKFYPHDGKGGKSHGDYGVETSDGRHLEYWFFTHNKVHQLKKIEGDEVIQKKYEYEAFGKNQLLTRIVHPEGRFFEVNYYKPGELYNAESNPVCFRVKELIAPAGENQERIVTHRFSYDLGNKKTTVCDAYGIPTEYYWNDDLRLIQINRFLDSETLYNQEKFIWGNNNSQDASNLLCKVMFNADQDPIFATRYTYDESGNIEKETFYGDLTGQAKALQLDAQGFPLEDSAENYSKYSSYSQDGKNLLLSQREENGLSVSYSYFKNTPLVEEEIYFAHGEAQKRRNYAYDNNGILYRDTTEDLQGNFYVTLNITNKKASKPHKKTHSYEYPMFPMVVEKTYGKKDTRKSLTQTVFSYTAGGRIQEQKVMDNKGNTGNTSMYGYSQGNLVAERNALGKSTSNQYDLLKNLISCKDFEGRAITHIQYDLVNRPTGSREEGESLVRTYRCRHDSRGHKIEAYDPYGNKISHEYDPFGHVLKTYLPSEGILSFGYDAVGNVISSTDAKGYTTKTSYNAYNKPTYIEYPNGQIEHFIYNRDRTLKEHIDQSGLSTFYEYDVFGRVLTATTLYFQESKTYDSFNVLSETDAEGSTVFYEYDEAGRKILEKRGQEEVHYTYDSFGRLYSTTSGELSLLKFYNLMDQVIEEKKVDASGKVLQSISYEYTPSGLLASTKKSIDGKTAVEALKYDALKRLISQTNAEGGVTRIAYDDNAHLEVHTDAAGSYEIRSINESNQIYHIDKYSSKNVLLRQEDYTYDLNQNLIQKEIYSGNQSSTTCWEFDQVNQVVSLVEGANTPDAKQTIYSYTSSGLLYRTIKPSGVVITNTYTPLGYLETQTSSDHSIYYSYEYNLNGLLKESTDERTGDTLSRSYNSQGRLLRETFPIGFSFKNSYDSMGRRTSLGLPDGSSILYDYDALYLRSVSRIKNGKAIYNHKYIAYDLSGNLLLEAPFSGSPTTYHYDVLGRCTEVQSAYFLEKALAFDPVGNLLSKIRNGAHFSYTYDPLYQLTSEKDHTYAFDTFYNRTRKNQDTFTSNALNQTSALSYDIDGNPTSWQGKKLSYDALDRLVLVEDRYQKIVYTYDSLHRRLSKKVYEKGILTCDLAFLYDDQNEIGAFDNLTQEFVELRILGNAPRAEIGAAIALELQGKICLPIHDLQGNVAVLVIDGALENYSYTAFGEENHSSLNPWRFSSKRVDLETGFVYFGRRYYIPEFGRFLTPDPLGLEAGPNVYLYAVNAPLTHFDLYGLFHLATPYPYDSDAPTLSGQIFGYRSEKPEKEVPAVYTVGTKDVPNRKIIFISGINTSKNEALAYGKLISDYGDGIKVDVIHTPSSGFLLDPVKAFIGYKNPTETSKLIKEHCNAFLQQARCDDFLSPDKPSNAKILAICHSNGATHMYHYLTGKGAQQHRFVVRGFAPATVITNELCFGSYNCRSSRDPIPLVRCIGSKLRTILWGHGAKSFKELHTLPSHKGATGINHSFNSPTFDPILEKDIEAYLRGDLNFK